MVHGEDVHLHKAVAELCSFDSIWATILTGDRHMAYVRLAVDGCICSTFVVKRSTLYYIIATYGVSSDDMSHISNEYKCIPY